jgi:branched-chain amino acid transport system ATP-binding protein
MLIVDHHAETVLAMSDRAYVLVNGAVAFEGPSFVLAADAALQHRLLGVAHGEDAARETTVSPA